MTRHLTHLIRPAVAVALVAGIAAPIAGAGIDDGFGVRCALAMTQQRRDVAERSAEPPAGDRRHARMTPAPAPNVTIVQPGTFDWGDAGIGAAGAVGLVALTGGVVVLSRNGSRSGESTGELSEAGNA